MTESPPARPVVLAGNWKMNLVMAEVTAFADALREHYLQTWAGSDGPEVEVVLFPSSPFLAPLADALRSTPAMVGGQDLHPDAGGAHTGDVSGRQLRSSGASWVLCGHSERRQHHGESDDLVAAKAARAVEEELAPMVCVGETLEERESGATEAILQRQLDAVLEGCPSLLDGDGGPRWAVAYEPVWAIGTGRTATPEIAQQAHAFLRRRLRGALGEGAPTPPILYGGSAKPANCAELVAEDDVDGLLVGGASLDPASFLDMIQRCGS